MGYAPPILHEDFSPYDLPVLEQNPANQIKV